MDEEDAYTAIALYLCVLTVLTALVTVAEAIL